MGSRLFRISLVIVLLLALVFGFKSLAGYKKETGGSFLEPITKKLDEVGEKVLGEAIKVLPKAPSLEDNEKVQNSQEEALGEETASEPIEEPVKNIEKQTEILIKEIKSLPQDQIEAIKKQIYKEMCEVLEEE